MVYYSGIVIDKTDKYTIYSSSTSYEYGINEYYLYIPNTNDNRCSLYINFANEKDSNYKNNIAQEINEIINRLNNKSIVYAIPILPDHLSIDENNINDDKLYTEIANSLISISSDVFNHMIVNEHKEMEQCVHLVTKTISDKNFVYWLNSSHIVKNPQFAKLFKTFNLQKEISITNNDELPKLYEDSEFTGNSGNSLSGGSSSNSYEVGKPKVKVLISPSKHGFSSITFLSLIISLSLVLGIGIAYILIK